MSAILAAQIVTILLLLAGTFFFGILPIGLRRTLLSCDCSGDVCKASCRARKGKVATSFLIYLGGGVLLATCFIHLLPEAREGFEEHERNLRNIPTVSAILNFSATTSEGSTPSIGGEDNATELPKDEHHHEEFPIPEFVVTCGFFAVYLLEEVLHYFLGHSHIPTETKAIRTLSRSSSCAHPCQPSPIAEGQIKENQSQTSIVMSSEMNNSQQIIIDNDSAVKVDFSVSGLLTVVALSFHSVFEGFAIGLQDSVTGTWILFAAIAVHKFVIAFVVGLEVLAEGSRDLLLVIYMAVFASMSPIGVIAALATKMSVEESSPLTVGVLNAIATGTLLYVTFFEILQRRDDSNIPSWQQLVATFLGFGVMCLVQYGSTFA